MECERLYVARQYRPGVSGFGMGGAPDHLRLRWAPVRVCTVYHVPCHAGTARLADIILQDIVSAASRSLELCNCTECLEARR